MDNVNKKFNKNMVLSVLKGCFIAIAVSLIGILFFAFVIKLFGLTDGFIKPVNQVIKGFSILIGVFIALKKDKEKGLVKGLVIGLVYTVVAFVVFSILNGSFNIDKSLLTDVLFGAIMGAICGVVAVNLMDKNTKKLSKI